MSVRPPVIKRLFAQSSNRCAFPMCTDPIVDGELVLGEICHIAAASAQGPRYDARQSDEVRNGFDNLILLCPTHHKVVDADLEAYTVDRLLKMKADHEKAATAVPDQQASDGALLILDNSVRSHNQSGGVTAQTVNAGTINLSSSSAADDRTTKAVERLWQIILDLKSAFSDLTFVDSILTPDELNRYFSGADSHPLFDSARLYRSQDVIIEKMKGANFAKGEMERPFVSPRLWAIFWCIQAIYGRTAMLYALSFKKRSYDDWRSDHGIDQHLRAVLPIKTVDEVRQQTHSLQSLLGLLESLFTDAARPSRSPWPPNIPLPLK
ncbi:hypothetical protein [Bradyrhizobium sp. ERR14]|uniref:hypothetical protein n=1 Tax=Bradyrhizobium sp. ERR14 TaxID=2663837 RepID=UPI001621F25C|nr:hypothetical protein [Bradyrhizobium sp. ERR14]MBB4395072.1 hypothetical protein [Bradyrhizobium sp. ERR14]